MLWHETTSPAVVVMLTRTHEMGRERCFPYFPQTTDAPQIKLNTANEFEDDFVHDLNMTSLVEDESVRAQVRELNMTTEDGSETKKIWHLLFAGWPDFGVPEGADWDALTKLIHMSREKNDHNHGNPRIVHCSAGVGRSGTFIALDWLLNELEDGSLDEVDDDYDPVQHVVESMRQQRMWMVQSEPQLVFIYDLIRDRWRDRWVALHAEDAERLGVTHDGEQDQPRLKRQKSVRDEGNEDDRAQLEGELIDAQMEFDKGKT
jgi:protein-tyrosine phosphatase